MSSSTITSKGQITVPKDVRDLLGVKAGDRLAFHRRADGTVVVEAETVDLRGLRGAVRTRRRKVTIEEMKEVVRNRGAIWR